MISLRMYRWKPAQDAENFGDCLSIPLLRALGIEPLEPVPGEPCLFAVGSILSEGHYRACGASRVIVWGSGGGVPAPRRCPLDVRAVRGPLTVETFCLSPDTVLGDPALLLPDLLPLPSVPPSGVVYVPHVSNPPIQPEWADRTIPTRIQLEDVPVVAAGIASARFVATASLHGAIVAQAYGVPWGPCSMQGIRPSFKWCDWLRYLGLDRITQFPTDLIGARTWWEQHGRYGRVGEFRRLLDVLPRSLT